MSSGKVDVWKRIFDLWASIVKMVQNGTRSPEWLARKLQVMVDETVLKFELYPHPTQKEEGTITGFDIYAHLKKTGRLKHALYTQHPQIQYWIKNPETYPENYRSRNVFLWGSIKVISMRCEVVEYLSWHDGRLVVKDRQLDFVWLPRDPALLEVS